MTAGTFFKWLSRTWFGFLNSLLLAELGAVPIPRDRGDASTTTFVNSDSRRASNTRLQANCRSLDNSPFRRSVEDSLSDTPMIGVL